MVKVTKDITKTNERRFSVEAEMTSNGAKFIVRHEHALKSGLKPTASL